MKATGVHALQALLFTGTFLNYPKCTSNIRINHWEDYWSTKIFLQCLTQHCFSFYQWHTRIPLNKNSMFISLTNGAWIYSMLRCTSNQQSVNKFFSILSWDTRILQNKNFMYIPLTNCAWIYQCWGVLVINCQ